ncbi:MAG TPA: PIN domain-containing protein [Chthoniobacterales bacterium]
MIYFPDTNAFSAHLRGTSPALSTRMVEALEAGELRFSIVVFLELAYGARKAELAGEKRPAARVAKLRDVLPIEPLTESVAAHYARIRTALERDGRLIGGMDLLIGAHALALEATVVTANVGEFSRVAGLKVENWQAAA